MSARTHLIYRYTAWIVAPMLVISGTANAQALKCVDLFAPSQLVAVPLARSTSQAWNESIQALKIIDKSVYGRTQVIESLATAILAKEFVWINGEPGGAKTFLSRLMFQSVLNALPANDKKIFVLQFHKLISEGKISGFQKFSSMMKDGKYEIETESSLVGDKFLFLIADEAEKSNPAVLNALLSVLNERKAFLGVKVVDAILSSGVFTSNKTTGEFIQGFANDRPSGEALLDRMALKIHIPNQQMSARETVAMYDMVKNPSNVKAILPLKELEALVAKVKISDVMMTEIVSIAREFDKFVTDKADKSRAAVRYGESESEYFPANQFSNRSVRRMVQVFKSAFIARQLMQGVGFEQMRLEPNRSDLSLLAKSALYIGPSGLKLKTFDLATTENGVKVTSEFGAVAKLAAQYSPYEKQMILLDGAGTPQIILEVKNNDWQVKSKSADYEEWSVDTSSAKALDAAADKLIVDQNIDINKPQFDTDNKIAALFAKGTIKERTRLELESIQKDLEHFANVLNQHFDKEAKPSTVVAIKLLPQRTTKEKRALRREMRHAPADVRMQRYYDWMTYEIRAIRQRFVELDHSIEAHLTGILSENHLYVFGPPGGAKTALAEVMLKSELEKMNASITDAFVKETIAKVGKDQKFMRAVISRMRKEKPQYVDRFMLQFHKLLPEGVLVGFPKVDKQLQEGIEEIEVSTSLANQKFIFSILDEVDKANPQTITALLSILNEREVFAGNQVIKTALRTAILTSNKMPSEFLDSYYEDRTTGEALLDRAINKVYVSNKIASEEALTQFLVNLEKGISPSWKGLLAVDELKPLVNKVEFEHPVMKEILAMVHEKFLSLRIQREEETRKAHRMDGREFPDYYVSAAGSASDRTVIKLFDQFKARFIAHQLMEGVAYKDLRLTVGFKDLALFFEGLAYWAPQKIVPSMDGEGVLAFDRQTTTIDNLIKSGVVDSRVKFHLEMMLEESRDFTQSINTVVGEFAKEYKGEIMNYPDLFPGHFNKAQGN